MPPCIGLSDDKLRGRERQGSLSIMGVVGERIGVDAPRVSVHLRRMKRRAGSCAGEESRAGVSVAPGPPPAASS
jgi:hypothetical protein